VDLGVVGSQPEGAAVTGDRLVQLAQELKRTAQVAVGLGEVGSLLDGPSDVLDRQVGAAGLQCDHAEKVPGIRVVGIGSEDLLIKGLGPLKVTGPVALHPEFERRAGVTHGSTV
jgi:hypothetical protein